MGRIWSEEGKYSRWLEEERRAVFINLTVPAAVFPLCPCSVPYYAQMRRLRLPARAAS